MSLDIWFACDSCGHEDDSFNITHNMCEMARKAKVYECLWNPIENKMMLAEDIIEPLKKGIEKMESKPDYFKKFDPPNKWGSYDSFLKFCKEVLDAARRAPKSKIGISK